MGFAASLSRHLQAHFVIHVHILCGPPFNKDANADSECVCVFSVLFSVHTVRWKCTGILSQVRCSVSHWLLPVLLPRLLGVSQNIVRVGKTMCFLCWFSIFIIIFSCVAMLFCCIRVMEKGPVEAFSRSSLFDSQLHRIFYIFFFCIIFGFDNGTVFQSVAKNKNCAQMA